jgi:hypothetical protein
LITFEFVARRPSDEDSNFEILEMIWETSEPSKELMKQEVDLFRRYPKSSAFWIGGLSTSPCFLQLPF